MMWHEGFNLTSQSSYLASQHNTQASSHLFSAFSSPSSVGHICDYAASWNCACHFATFISSFFSQLKLLVSFILKVSLNHISLCPQLLHHIRCCWLLFWHNLSWTNSAFLYEMSSFPQYCLSQVKISCATVEDSFSLFMLQYSAASV